MHLVKPQLGHQRQRILKLRLRLAGKPHNNIRADGNIRDGIPYFRHQLPVLGHRIRTPHLPQHFIIPRLHRQIDMLANLGQIGHRLNDAPAHIRGMRSQKPDAFQPGDIVQPCQQVGQILPVCPVVSVGVHRLPQRGDFPHAPRRQQRRLLRHLVHRPARLPPPPVGNDAETAHQIAPVDNRHIGGNIRPLRRQRPHAPLPVQPLPFPHQRQQRLKLLRTQKQIHIGEPPFQLCRARPHHTPGQRQHRIRPPFPQRLRQVQRPRNLVLRRLPHHARIEHDHIGIGRPRHSRKPQLLQSRPQTLGIGGIHLAADRPDVIGLHRNSFPLE